MKILKILIPTDFSDVSLLALQMADVIATRVPVNIHVLHVIEANTSDAGFLEGINNSDLEQEKQNALLQLISLKSAWREFKPHISIGLLTDEINRVSSELEADMVIMGTHGSDGFMEMISGSEAQHVARYLKVPVITVRLGTPVTELKNILLVADFELFGKGAQINTVKTIAEAFDSTIHLLQILRENDEKYAGVIEAQMKFFAAEHHIQKYETHLYRDRKIADGVRNFNREAEMDLVCIRTHGRKGISHLLFGSIAERLVNHCVKPLLTFQLKPHA